MNLKKKLAPILLIGVSTLILCTTSSYAQNGKITGDTVRLRKEPNTSAGIITNLDKGDTVEVLEKSGEWYKVKYQEENGYVYGDYLKIDTSEENSKDDNKKENTSENENNNNEIKVNSTQKVKQDSKLHVLPLIHSEKKTDVKKDSDALVLQIVNNWVYVTCGNTNGWIVKKDLTEEIKQQEETKPEEPKKEEQTETKETSTNETKTKTGYVNVESANVRERATTDSEPITALTLNTEVTIIGEENNWYKIQLGNSQGYIYSKLVSNEKTVKETSRASNSERTGSQEEKEQSTVEISNKTIKGTDIVDYAKQFLGYKYVSGGTGPNSFDCSGFTQYVYKHFGYTLARTTGDQAKNGVKVEKSDLQEGDLLIFLNDSKSSIGHVGIYIGNDRFIHAANPSRGVVTDSVSNSYYQPRYVTARRII